MSPEQFVVQIRKAIIADNLSIYRDLFATTTVQGASDPYWKRALSLYAKLGPEDRSVLFEIIRQVMADSISNVFAVLDGVTQIEGQKGDFNLSEDGNRLNGELQDRFLELEESDSQS